MLDMTMKHYCSLDKNDLVHVTNTVTGHQGQHHIHTREDFKRWRADIDDDKIIWLPSGCFCDCGLGAGEVQSREDRFLGEGRR